MSKRQFIKEFLKKGEKVGSVTPSSKFLVKKMLAPINFDEVLFIVELGPGTGKITEAILERMRPDARLMVFELNQEFCAKLEDLKDERLIVVNDSAESMRAHLQEVNVEKVDCIISSLPFTILPDEVVEKIMAEVTTCLKNDAPFVQYQYSLNQYKNYKKLFTEVKLDFTPLNVPPAFVYKCKT